MPGIDFSLLLPELAIVSVIALLALSEMLLNSSPAVKKWLQGLAFFAVTVALGGNLARSGTTFGGMFASDPLAVFFKFFFLATAGVVCIMRGELQGRTRDGEFYLLLWSTLLGMFFLVSSKDFLLFFVSLELLTLSLYVLAAYSSNSLLPTVEAGLKYLILGSLASAFLIYGLSLIYASTGTLSFGELGEWVRTKEGGGQVGIAPTLFTLGILLVISALGFKVAAVPFHVWVPDVYQGAPTPVVAFLSVASKALGFAAFVRILFEVIGPWEEMRRALFSVLAVLTLFYGNLGALVQRNMKRLLGYSSIGHAGFLLLALTLDRGWLGISLFYYLIAYAFSNLTAFLILSVVEKRSEGEMPSAPTHDFDEYRGLARRSPLLGAGLFIALLSLAGVPPLAGFFAKFLILLSLARSGLYVLLFLGAVNVAVSLYYYLNVIRILYVEKAEREAPLAAGVPATVLLFGLMAGIVTLGFWQAPVFQITRAITF